MDCSKLPVRELEIEGQKYRVAYPMISIFALCDIGVDLLAADVKETLRGKTLRQQLEDTIKVFWAGLIFEKPEITLLEVERMVHLGNLGQISDVCNEAFTASLPAAKEEQTDIPLAQPGPGSVQ